MQYLTICIFMFGILNADLIAPQNNSELSYTHIVFEWEQEAGAVEYNLQVSLSPNFLDLIVDIIDPSLMFILKEGIDWNAEYFWRVRAIDDNGQSLDFVE